MNTLINDYFYSMTQVEKLQKKYNRFFFDYPNESIKNNNQSIMFLNTFFLKNKSIFINKHNRFADYPEHTHNFLELNYMYSGNSKQTINGNEEILTKGNILLIDKGSSHSINKLADDDILINIIFKNKKMDLEWISSLMKTAGSDLDFLIDHFKETTEKKYIIFNSENNHHIQIIIENILEQYYLSNSAAHVQIIEMYIPILLTELISNCSYKKDSITKSSANDLTLNLLKIIEKNIKNITLDFAASTLGYNKNYLSNLIKTTTGKTFTQILLSMRLEKAKNLLLTTDLSIGDIINEIGLHNKTYFYDKFQQSYGCLPSEMRI